jgi:hypothetical protein
LNPRSVSKEISQFLRPANNALPILLIVWGVWLLWGFGCQTVFDRLLLEVDGTVTSEQNVPSKGAPRYATYYALRSSTGSISTYAAGATDASLERGLPVGTRIHKTRWQLGYEINDHWVSFPVIFYSLTLCIGLAAIMAGVVRWRALRKGGSE